MKARFHPAARAELIEAKKYYNRERRGLGRELVEQVRLAAAKISNSPLHYGEIEAGVRCGQTARFPYGLVYVVRKAELVIVAVMHLHREPGYWRNRLE